MMIVSADVMQTEVWMDDIFEFSETPSLTLTLE